MKVLVVGATGRTGRRVVEQAHGAGHGVRALSRSIRPDGLPNAVEVVAGDACDPAVVAEAVAGVDAIIVALSMVRTSDNPWAAITTPRDLHSRAAGALLAAAAKAGVTRYLTISAHGVGPSRPRAGWGERGPRCQRGLEVSEGYCCRPDERWNGQSCVAVGGHGQEAQFCSDGLTLRAIK